MTMLLLVRVPVKSGKEAAGASSTAWAWLDAWPRTRNPCCNRSVPQTGRTRWPRARASHRAPAPRPRRAEGRGHPCPCVIAGTGGAEPRDERGVAGAVADRPCGPGRCRRATGPAHGALSPRWRVGPRAAEQRDGTTGQATCQVAERRARWSRSARPPTRPSGRAGGQALESAGDGNLRAPGLVGAAIPSRECPVSPPRDP
jgi:hypothetical protein